MVLKDFIQSIDPNEVVYLGCDSLDKRKIKCNGSGFVYIGLAQHAPVGMYGDRTVLETYPHYTDYPGTTILINGLEHGSYWTWNEYDPAVPLNDIGYQQNETVFENLLMAIARLAVLDYKQLLHSTLKRVNPTDMMEVEDIIAFCRRKGDLDFLLSSNMGQYLIQAVEDELRVEFKYPKVRKMPYYTRYDFLRKKRHEEITERVKRQAKSRYATIKGRSVNHDLDG